jgi:uncharacterized membrane protein YkvA (DUF1232 family)
MKISLVAVYDWYRRAIRHPQYRWLIILGTLAYLVSPFDLSPDIFPIAGQIDDLVLVTLLLSEISQMGIEWFKTRQVSAPTSETASAESAQTVDVNAVNLDA